ncbi:MAG: A/G-specific adenine glycosylase [Sphingomonadales bacterium]
MKRAAAPKFSKRLLGWFDRGARDLPWRQRGGGRDPYAVWLAEIMLQQTTVAAVGPYYEQFLKRWPDVETLAASPGEEVLKAWAGLGYYSRARSMIKCARLVSGEMAGRFPEDEEGLRQLPGIGPYTAAAIAAIAFGQQTAVVDGNVERIASRLFRLGGDPRKTKQLIRDRVRALVPAKRAGDFAEAMMDLGATVCRPRAPICDICPVSSFCGAFLEGDVEAFPKRRRPAPKPHRRGRAYFLHSGDEALLVRRPDKGLLGGMLCLPSGSWLEHEVELGNGAPVDGDWVDLEERVSHSFTHFHLSLSVATLALPLEAERPEGEWVRMEEILKAGLPKVMEKAVSLALASLESV